MAGGQPGTLALVGAGRAGPTVAFALTEVGWKVSAVAGRDARSESVTTTALLLDADPATPSDVAIGADLVIVATPDAQVPAAAARVMASVEPGALVIHLAGSLGLAAFHEARRFRDDVRFGALHPLVSIPSVSVGLARLPGAFAAVAGDPEVSALAESMAMRPFSIEDADRPTYHAAAATAANHLVALLGQVERLAEASGVPFDAFMPLVRSAVENTADVGPRDALTGPVARGEVETILSHLRALPESERPTYLALAREARRLLERTDDLLDAVLFGDEGLPERLSEEDRPARLAGDDVDGGPTESSIE